jgi:hypothetical protein
MIPYRVSLGSQQNNCTYFTLPNTDTNMASPNSQLHDISEQISSAIALADVVETIDMRDNPASYESCTVYTFRVDPRVRHTGQDSEDTWRLLAELSVPQDAQPQIYFACSSAVAANAKTLLARSGTYTLFLERSVQLPEVGLCVYKPSRRNRAIDIASALRSIMEHRAWIDRSHVSTDETDVLRLLTVSADTINAPERLRRAECSGRALAVTGERAAAADYVGAFPVYAVRLDKDDDAEESSLSIPGLRKLAEAGNRVVFAAHIDATKNILNMHIVSAEAGQLLVQRALICTDEKICIFAVSPDCNQRLANVAIDAICTRGLHICESVLSSMVRRFAKTPSGLRVDITSSEIRSRNLTTEFVQLCGSSGARTMCHSVATTRSAILDMAAILNCGRLLAITVLAEERRLRCIDAIVAVFAIERLYELEQESRTGSVHWPGLARLPFRVDDGGKPTRFNQELCSVASAQLPSASERVVRIGNSAVHEHGTMICMPIGYMPVDIAVSLLFRAGDMVEIEVESNVSSSKSSKNRVLTCKLGALGMRHLPWARVTASVPGEFDIDELHFVQLTEERWHALSQVYELERCRALLGDDAVEILSPRRGNSQSPVFMLVPSCYIETGQNAVGKPPCNDGEGWILASIGDLQIIGKNAGGVADVLTQHRSTPISQRADRLLLMGCGSRTLELERRAGAGWIVSTPQRSSQTVARATRGRDTDSSRVSSRSEKQIVK